MKIAIIGKAPSSRLLAPFDDESWEIWSLSDNHTVLPRWNQWFELHDLDRYKEAYGDYYDWLCSLPANDKPVWVTEVRDEMPAGRPFPWQELAREFQTQYFTNSISWMTALAIHQIIQTEPAPPTGCVNWPYNAFNTSQHEIAYYGVDMAQNTEFAHQRPSCEYFLGVAWGLGIKIHVPEESDLMKCSRMYCVESQRGQMDRKIRTRRRELQQRKVRLAHDVEKNQQAVYVLSGAVQAFREITQLPPDVLQNGQIEERIKLTDKDLNEATMALRESTKMRDRLDGALEDLDWCSQWA